jgi:hypothetical protein
LHLMLSCSLMSSKPKYRHSFFAHLHLKKKKWAPSSLALWQISHFVSTFILLLLRLDFRAKELLTKRHMKCFTLLGHRSVNGTGMLLKTGNPLLRNWLFLLL